MQPEMNRESSTNVIYTDESVSFDRVNAVVTEWTLDFMFLSLCRRFKEGKLDEFSDTLSTLEAIFQGLSQKKSLHDEKMMLCAFLARVMHGKQLDVQFEEDSCVMPLMSAAKIWSGLEGTVADKILVKNITTLLLVQSVAVCMEKGQMSSASSALKWFENNHEFPENLRVKLTTVVEKRETYHPLIMSYSFSRLLETVQSYLDLYLKKNPSDYLLKAATKMIQSSQSVQDVEDKVTRKSSVSETDSKSTKDTSKQKNAGNLRTKRKLLSTKVTDVWKPDTCKKPFVSVRRISKSELSQLNSKTSVDDRKDISIPKKRKPPQKWTAQLDKYLKNGVKRHGQGKWSRILMDYDFEGRTGTMLKDRWRVLMRSHQVD